MGRKSGLILISLLIAFGLFSGNCASTTKTKTAPTPAPSSPPTESPTSIPIPIPKQQSPKSAEPTPSPLPSLPTAKATGRTVTEQDKAKDSDTWASYLREDEITAIAVDQDCLWLGTDSGLIRFSKKEQEITLTYYGKEDGLSGVDIQTLKFYDGELWIGTRGGGLSKFDGKHFTNYGEEQGLFDHRVMALDVNEDYVWLGLCFGLSQFDKGTQTFQNWELSGGYLPGVGSGSGVGAGTDPRRIFADSILIDGEYIWHSAYNVNRSDRDVTKSAEIGCGPLPSSRVTSICKATNSIYAATTLGLSRIDLSNAFEWTQGQSIVLQTPVFKWFTTKEGMLSNGISALALDGKYLWVGTDVGVNRFDTDNYEIHYYDDYVGGVVLSIATDDTYVWLGTSDGLFRLNKEALPKKGEPGKAWSSEDDYVISGSGPLLANFEEDCPIRGQVPLYEEWYDELKGIRTRRITDKGANGTSSSYSIEFELPQKVADQPNISLSVFHPFFIEKDLIPYEGITLFAKADPSLETFLGVGWGFHLVENGPLYPADGRPVECWQTSVRAVPTGWTRVTIPFAAFSLNEDAGIVNRVFDLAMVDQFRTLIHFGEWRGGEKGRIWIDEISFYKPGEFKPTVPTGKTPVNREKEQ